METKAVLLFQQFPSVNQLYRTNDGEYFVELDDVEAYLTGLGAGAYTVVNRTTPLPPLPQPIEPVFEQLPIWVLIANPTVISDGLRYDGVLSYTSTTIGSVGVVDMIVNKVGAYRVGNYVLAVSRKSASLGMMKYGKITAISNNVLSISFLASEGTANLVSDEWDLLLTGQKGDKGDKGDTGARMYSGAGVPSNGSYVQGDWYINTTTSDVYEKTGASAWTLRTNIKGDAAYKILTGTGSLQLSNADLNKTLIVLANSAITGIRLDNVSVAGSFNLLCLKALSGGIAKVTNDISQASQALSQGAYIAVNVNAAPVSGVWYDIFTLKGDTGDAGYKVLTGTGSVGLTESDLSKTIIIPQDSGIHTISLNALSTGNFVVYNFKTTNVTCTKTNQAPIATPINAGKGALINIVEADTFTLTEIGSTGEKGDIGLVWKGTYSTATAYAVNDAVTNGTSSYICKVAHTNQPLTNTTYWQIIALGGGTPKMYKGTHSVSNVATVITHNLALADPSKVIVQILNPDGSNYYFAHKFTAFTANSLTITLVAEAGPINFTVIIMSV